LEPTLPLGVNGAFGVASALLADPPAEPDDGRMNYTNDAFAWLLVALLVGMAATAILRGRNVGRRLPVDVASPVKWPDCPPPVLAPGRGVRWSSAEWGAPCCVRGGQLGYLWL
jgi:hypothetical protein